MLVVAEWVQFRPSSSVSFVSLSRLLCAFAIRINWIGALPNFHNFRQTNAAKRNEWISAHTPHSSAGEFYIFICFVNLCMNVNTAYILSCVVVAHTTRFRRKEYFFFLFVCSLPLSLCPLMMMMMMLKLGFFRLSQASAPRVRLSN